MKLIYLHGFASGPHSSKAQFFRRRFEELGVPVTIPELDERDFEHLTLGGQLRVIERVVPDEVVKCEYSEEFAARNPAAALRVMESGHDLLNVQEEMWTAASEFLGGR